MFFARKDGKRRTRTDSFSNNRPWDASEFTASDDRVRGGRSQSHLTVVVDENGSANSSSAAKFWGHLDITALGGAGFASQRTVDDFPVWDLSAYDTLVLDVAESDGKKYTVTLKDEVLPKRPDGREQSTVSWEYDFKVAAEDAEAAASSSGPRKVVIPFADFAPTYRGKPKPNAEPLDLKSVKRVSFMMRRFVVPVGPFFPSSLVVLFHVSYRRRSGWPCMCLHGHYDASASW